MKPHASHLTIGPHSPYAELVHAKISWTSRSPRSGSREGYTCVLAGEPQRLHATVRMSSVAGAMRGEAAAAISDPVSCQVVATRQREHVFFRTKRSWRGWLRIG